MLLLIIRKTTHKCLSIYKKLEILLKQIYKNIDYKYMFTDKKPSKEIDSKMTIFQLFIYIQ